MHSRCIQPARRPVDADLAAPPSKSWTHRALVAAAIADGVTRIEGPLEAADTRCTRRGLEALGIAVTDDPAAWSVRGLDGVIEGGAHVECEASGTSARFLTALAALGRSGSHVDGSPRLRQRPMEELLGALESLGASVEATGGALPVRVGGGDIRGGAVAISGARSSQFASALLLIGPALPQGLELTVAAPRASYGYALLTVRVLERFGAVIRRPWEGAFQIARQRLVPAVLRAEGDHSSEAYGFLAAAVTGGRVRVRGLDAASLQPDARFHRDLAAVGCSVAVDETGIEVRGTTTLAAFDWDLEDAPDLAPTAAVLALFCRGESRLRGLGNLRLKESDRLEAVSAGLAGLGASVRAEEGALIVRPPSQARGAFIDVADDHRIAMAFAIAGLRLPGITLSDSEVTAKSYPGFWEDFERLAGPRTGS